MTTITKNDSSSIPKRYNIEQWDDENLDLKPSLLRGIFAYGFEKPSSIQKQSLYPIISRPATDIIAQAQSGTGKTGAFVTSILQIVDMEKNITQALILAPTHELALQTKQVIDDIGRFLKVKTQLLVGGTSVENDKKQFILLHNYHLSNPTFISSTTGSNVISATIKRKVEAPILPQRPMGLIGIPGSSKYSLFTSKTNPESVVSWYSRYHCG